MAYQDLREFIVRLEEEGELVRIKEEVDWDLEVGGILRRSQDLKAPAPFFENIKGYEKGYRILGGSAGVSNKPGRYFARLALSLGLDPTLKTAAIIEELIRRRKKPIKPVIVSTGVCKENVNVGEEVNLFKFPAPVIHGGDGGRYIGTWHTVITKDPDSGWVNWGMYRLMVHDQKTMGGIIVPSQHIGQMYYPKYEARNKPMPFAVAMGNDPVIPIVSCWMLPAGVDEADAAGGLRGAPVELVKCETVDLYVPATSEIVIEGEVLPHERSREGPFGEFVGYRASEASAKPVYRVNAITHRNNPILPISCMGVPVDESAAVVPITNSAEILDELRQKGLPVKMVYCPPEGISYMAVVSTEVPYPNFAKKVAYSLWATKAGTFIPYVIVTDDDVDVTNMEEVIHTLCVKCHPYRRIYKYKDSPIYPVMTPFLAPEYRMQGSDGANVLFDCTWPKEWPAEATPTKASFEVLWPKDIQTKILKKWNKYGYE